ncbi:hypothetical protein [Mucisphaera calidilacus]|uniref:Uncharacterized protein n=1 Tax=Mucisphaera calidilacus TaxID=2527982 RepID=A0A518C092_9BACT|nr:hypothetical protein [Mucisphaera calidilacus]QDU72633.1 hypothetical protein Pan265_25050 [Mucisphaera calidilacus]
MIHLTLILLAALESVIYLWRIRSANRSSVLSSSLSAVAVQAVRVTGMGSVVYTMDQGDLWPLLSYVAATGLFTALTHHLLSCADA